MFLSLVRPERISSPITSRAAVTKWAELAAVMFVLGPFPTSFPTGRARSGFKSCTIRGKVAPGRSQRQSEKVVFSGLSATICVLCTMDATRDRQETNDGG